MAYSATVDVPDVGLSLEDWLGGDDEVTVWIALAYGRRPVSARVRVLMRRESANVWCNVAHVTWTLFRFRRRANSGLLYVNPHGGEGRRLTANDIRGPGSQTVHPGGIRVPDRNMP
jgi:hypothetical protein